MLKESIKLFITLILGINLVCCSGGMSINGQGNKAFNSNLLIKQNNQDTNLNIDKIFVINLDRSAERLAKVKKQLELHNLKFERFRAIDGYKLVFQNLEEKKFNGIELKNKSRKFDENKLYKVDCPSLSLIYNSLKRPVYEYVTAGEFGCTCSNLEILRRVADNNLGNVLILEDDVILDKDFNNNLSKVLNNVPKKWDIIYLYYGKEEDKKAIKTKNKNLLKLVADTHCIGGTAGYIVNSRSAKKLLLNSLGIELPIDTHFSELINKSIIEAYITIKPIIHISDDKSLIHEMGREH